MVIPVWDSHVFMMVYLKMKLLAGEDGVSCFQTELCAFHKTWRIFLALSVCLNLIGKFFYPFPSVNPSWRLKCYILQSLF